MCSSRFVEPPNAACTSIAFSTARRSGCDDSGSPSACSRWSARAERRPSSSQTASPDGASALCGKREAERFGDDLRRRRGAEKLAAAARRPACAAAHRRGVIETDQIVREARAQALDLTGILGARVPASVTPPGTTTPGRCFDPASASIVAGSPLSQVAMPRTPDAVGSDRISRRITIAASLRYARLSNMPVVPCVRPSHGSLQ